MVAEYLLINPSLGVPGWLVVAVDQSVVRVNPMIARRYTTIDLMVGKSIATKKFRAVLLSSFAGVGVLLAMLGVYGTVAYSAVQRRFEFGVRMAFGAERGAILRSVSGQAPKMACLGICDWVCVESCVGTGG